MQSVVFFLFDIIHGFSEMSIAKSKKRWIFMVVNLIFSFETVYLPEDKNAIG